MTPQSFEFTLSMPGDARLVGAVRDLTTHAAGYAQLPAESAQALVAQVASATEAAIAATDSSAVPIDLRFTADAARITVTISYPDRNGSRQTREVQHRIAS
jgi:hypothetical protein